jgi:hypothetical protein
VRYIKCVRAGEFSFDENEVSARQMKRDIGFCERPGNRQVRLESLASSDQQIPWREVVVGRTNSHDSVREGAQTVAAEAATDVRATSLGCPVVSACDLRGNSENNSKTKATRSVCSE